MSAYWKCETCGLELSKQLLINSGGHSHEEVNNTCGLCLPDKPCNFEGCPNDTVLAADYNALLARLSRAEALLERARSLVPYVNTSDQTLAIVQSVFEWIKDFEESRKG